jgi:tetratricopeptide (TPR) repeat protein
MPILSSSVNVQPLHGTAWFLANWPLVVAGCFLSLIPLYFLYRRFQTSNQRAAALFEYSLGENLRKGGDAKGALKTYDTILSRACTDSLLFRAHAGRAQALLALKNPKEALQAVDTAITLANVQELRFQARQITLERSGVAPPSASDNPDIDPFLHAAIPLGALHYSRACILDALERKDEADAEYEKACELDPSESFIFGYVAKREFADRRSKSKFAPSKSKQQGGASKRVNAAGEGVSATSTAGSKNVSPEPEPVAVAKEATPSKKSK